MKQFIQDKLGLILCISSLMFYFLLKTPFNLSVLGQTDNEGFYFVFGQNLLHFKELGPGRGILFIGLYSLVIKLFGFNAFAIIAIHIIQTVVVLLIGTIIYLIVNKALKNSIYAGLATLIWITLIIAPIGTSLKYEIMSHFAFEAEYLCVLFSLISILLLILSGVLNLEKSQQFGTKEKVLSFLSGVFCVFPLMCKPSGGAFLLAMILWFVMVFIKERLKNIKLVFFNWLAGVLFSFLCFQGLIYLFTKDLFSFWKDNFLIGSYSNNYLFNATQLFQTISGFLFRESKSLSNFILLIIAILLFSWGTLRCFTPNRNQDSISKFWLFISIWGFGNVCSVIVPGKYEPYYYHLVWAPIAIVLVLGIYETFSRINKKMFIVALSTLLTIFFIHRISLFIPVYVNFIKQVNKKSIFNQSQSFQDPVLPYEPSIAKRQGGLQLPDAINILLPDKSSTFYILNLHGTGLTCFTPLSYIYAKRTSPTNIISDVLFTQPMIEAKLAKLKQDLINRPPDIFVLSKDVNLPPWLEESMKPFFPWFYGFLQNNYIFTAPFECLFKSQHRIEYFDVYEKRK